MAGDGRVFEILIFLSPSLLKNPYSYSNIVFSCEWALHSTLGGSCSRSHTRFSSCPQGLSLRKKFSSELGVKDPSRVLRQCAKRESKVKAEQEREAVGRWRRGENGKTCCFDWERNLLLVSSCLTGNHYTSIPTALVFWEQKQVLGTSCQYFLADFKLLQTCSIQFPLGVCLQQFQFGFVVPINAAPLVVIAV